MKSKDTSAHMHTDWSMADMNSSSRTGGMMLTPSLCRASRWAAVKGLSHMKVFMAGATSSGREKSQARNCRAQHATPVS